MINPELTLVKSINALAATVGDVVDYKIVVENTGNVDATDVKVYDMLSEDLEFIEGSVKVDDEESTDNITSGVMIDEVKIGEKVTIEFKAKILAKGNGILKNQAVASYMYVVDGVIQFGEDSSNINELPVSFVNLKVKKTSNKEAVGLFDMVEYKVEVTNNGDVEAKNVRFIDKLPKYLELIQGTFRVNDNVIHSVNLAYGVNIGDIAVGQKVIITYKVKVVLTSCNAKLINNAIVTFFYEIDPGVTGIKVIDTPESKNEIDMRISTFKQLSVEEELEIPRVKPDIESINEMTGKVEILSCHLIETGAITSQENQRLTGYKLVISAMLNLVIKYTALDTEQSVHSAHYKIPFSTFIVLPDGYDAGSKLDVEGIVEDIYYKAHNVREFFTNTTLMVNVKILSCELD